MLGASGIRDRLAAGELVIEPFTEQRVRPRGYDLVASGDVYRLADIDRSVNPLNQETVDDAVAARPATGEIEVRPDAPVTIRSRERIALAPELAAVAEPHPSLARLGVTVRCDPDGLPAPDGPDGPAQLACSVRSANPNPVIIHPDQPLVRLRFLPVDGPDSGDAPATSAAVRPDFSGLATALVDEEVCVGITGLAASGKSVTAELLADLLAADTYGMGEVIRAEADRRGLDQTGENLNRVSQELRADHGEGVVAERLLDRLPADGDAGIRIIEGIRGPAEVAVFREELSESFFLLGVHASRATRIARLEERGRSDDAGGADTLATRDEKESGFGVREAIGMCDYIITNEGSLADLEREVERVAARICHRYG